MPRLVTKFKYLKPGTGGRSVGGYARYIATREGVERIDDSYRHAPATQKQQALIEKILRDFPDTKQSHEYRDFWQERTVGNASEFIFMAMEENLNAVANTKTYADYIATRPRAERFGSHGLFTDDGVEVQLSEVSKELNAYRGNVYTAILSLKREDAARLGFDHGGRWRDFLRGQTPTLSENLKIPMNHLRWYAAFHNEGHHPHVHLIACSTVPGEGHLSAKGVEKMRSVFAREIFSQELMFTYQQQTEYRDRLREQGRERVSEIVAKINAGEYLNPRIEELLVQLSDRLSRTTGKKVYGYLKSDVKAIVDQIVAELAENENIRELYDLWYEQREDVLRTYRLYTMAAIRGNAYAQYQLGRMYRDGIGTEADLEESGRWYAKAYAGFLAMEAAMADDKLCYRIGSMNMTGTGTEVDLEKSRYYFEKAVELGSADALYGLGKLYLKPEFSEYDPEKAVEYLEQAAAKDNAFARYQLGKLFCQGKLVQKDIARGLPLLEELAEAGVTSAAYIAGKVYLKEEGWQDVQKAIRCFHMAAEDGNSYAEYQLGKIYYFGNGIRVDREKGLEYLNRSAAHGNVYAENLLRVIQQQHIRGAASLIAQLGRMFQEKEQRQDRVRHQQLDRKQRRQIDEKKQAMGIRD
jgi:TPR repeat protein